MDSSPNVDFTSPWQSIDIHGHPWISMGVHGCWWIFLPPPPALPPSRRKILVVWTWAYIFICIYSCISQEWRGNSSWDGTEVVHSFVLGTRGVAQAWWVDQWHFVYVYIYLWIFLCIIGVRWEIILGWDWGDAYPFVGTRGVAQAWWADHWCNKILALTDHAILTRF